MIAGTLRMLLVVATFVVILLVAAWAGQRALIYFPAHDVPDPARMGLPQVEQVTFRTEDAIELRAWWMPATRPGATVIVFNGNGGHRAYRAPLGAALVRAGINVLLFDYRGYGGNLGTPGEEALAKDARAALTFVRGRPGVDSNRIYYFGESLGAAVALRLATEQAPAGLILRSPFTSLTAVGQYHYPVLPVRWLLRDRYASIDRIHSIKCPLLVIYGTRDTIVPPDQSRELFDAANEPKRLVAIEHADHNDYDLLAGERMLRVLLEFVQQGK